MPLNHTNQTCYLRAVSDSIQTNVYMDPLAVGAQQVWTGTYVCPAPGWWKIVFDAPFYLPAGMNLEVFWRHEHGSYPTNSNATFATTTTPRNMTSHGYSDGSFATAMTSGLTAQLARPDIRLTKQMPLETYIGNDLALLSVVSPVMDPTRLCEEAFAPVQLLLANLGDTDYDLSIDNVTVEYEITDPVNTRYAGTIVLNTGELPSAGSMVIELHPSMPILAGATEIRAWLVNNVDRVPYDDSIRHTHISTKLRLPVDEYFDGPGMPFEFKSVPVANGWEVVADDGDVLPNTRQGMIRYAGVPGAIAKLVSSFQVDMYQSVNPKIEFWYYHDNTISLMDNSFLQVNVIADGVTETVLTIFKQDGSGWTPYTVPLNKYTNAACVIIEFEAMNKFQDAVQYIDRIVITSEPDLGVMKILVEPEMNLCDYENRTISIVVTATTAQSIDFTETPTRLALNIPGHPTYYHTFTGNMLGRTSDTIPIAFDINFQIGATLLTAYLTTPIDAKSDNDTAYRTIFINPDIAIKAKPTTGGSDFTGCIFMGSKVRQEITLENKGDFDVFDIPVSVEIIGRSGSLEMVKDTVRTTLQAGGGTLNWTFTKTYTVPTEESYNVVVRAELDCDANDDDNEDGLFECVDMDDIVVLGVVNPIGTAPDAIGSTVNLAVELENISPLHTYPNVTVYAQIIDGTTVFASLMEPLTNVEKGKTVCTFSSLYTVPAVAEYTIKVFVASVDANPSNDTITKERTTNAGINPHSNKTFALGQNIPNPAKETTRIAYSIPQDGQVLFTVYSITGQTLHIEKKDAYSGENNIEFNTTNLADGIYYYSMEYNGERLVKKMTIRK